MGGSALGMRPPPPPSPPARLPAPRARAEQLDVEAINAELSSRRARVESELASGAWARRSRAEKAALAPEVPEVGVASRPRIPPAVARRSVCFGFVCLSLCLRLCVCLYLSLSLSLSVSLSLFLALCVCACVSLSHSLCKS